MGTLRKIAPKPSSATQPIAAKQSTTEKAKDQRTSKTTSKEEKKKSSKPIITSVKKTQLPIKKLPRKSADKAKKKIRKYSQPSSESSEEEEDTIRYDKLPTRTDQIKNSILRKILKTELPRRMKSTDKPITSRSDSSHIAGDSQPTRMSTAVTADPGAAHPVNPAEQSANLTIQKVEIFAEEGLSQQALFEVVPEAEVEEVIEHGGLQPAADQSQPRNETDEEPRVTEQPDAAAGASHP